MCRFLMTLALALVVVPFGGQSTEKQLIYVYKKEVNQYSSQSTWTLTKKGDELHIQGKSSKGSTTIISSLDRHTKQFIFKSAHRGDDYKIYRSGQELIASGTSRGKPIEKRYRLGTKLWLQEFDFSLKPFILSNQREIKFCIIHPKKLSKHNMAAKKQQLEQLSVNNTTYEALKVKISLTGFKGMFWSAQAWFDTRSGDLLQYIANEGPNTPTGIITLLSKKSAPS